MKRPGLLLALVLVALASCRLVDTGGTLTVGLHQAIGPVNPLATPDRPSLALQRLQLPALIEFAGRTQTGGHTHNRYRLSLIDSLPGAVDWDYKRRGGVFARFVLRPLDWYDPADGQRYPVTARDVQATLARIDQAHTASFLARQRGRLRLTPFLSFVAQAIDSVEVDERDERVLYVRFADHVLGPNRMHALTFRVLPARLLETLSAEADVAVTATPYYWRNSAATAPPPGGGRPPDAVPHFAPVADSDGLIGDIRFETRQDLRSYKLQLESGAYGLAYGLPQKPGDGLDLPPDLAWKAYASSDVWTFVFNCRRVPARTRRALAAALTDSASSARFAALVRQTYPNIGRLGLRRSVFPAPLIDRYPRVRQAIEDQARRYTMPPTEAASVLRGKSLRFVYGYGMGDPFEPDIIAATLKDILGGYGVQVADQRLEHRDFHDALAQGEDFDLALYKYAAAARLPEDFDLAQILPMRESRNPDGGYRLAPDAGNYFHFADETLYEALIQMRQHPTSSADGSVDTTPLERRQQALVAIDALVRRQAIGLFLFSPTYYWFWDRRFEVSFEESSVLGGGPLPRYSKP